jgi:hypothetical protein
MMSNLVKKKRKKKYFFSFLPKRKFHKIIFRPKKLENKKNHMMGFKRNRKKLKNWKLKQKRMVGRNLGQRKKSRQ